MCSRANVSCVFMCLRANVSCVLTCSRANVLYVLTCSRANVPCVFTCPRASVPCVLTCSRANVLCVLVCSRANVSCVLTWSRTNILCVLTSSRAITTNNKNKFSVTSLPYIFVIALCLFPVKQNCCTFLHFFYQAEAFNRCSDKLCTIKWFDFCLSITLRVIFKWLIKDGRWIIMYRS